MNPTAKGATAQEWGLFSLVLGLTEDLLPVVSDQAVQVSPNSKMKGLGKTPSLINRHGFAAGFTDWTSYTASEQDVEKWVRDPRLGICLQTRRVRAFDLDIEDEELCTRVCKFILSRLGVLPRRTRANSNKVLLLVEIEGEYTKRSFKAEHGIVEFLATGQQCIVAGTHPSGERYTWGTIPTSIPKVSGAEFEALWDDLVAQFAIEAPQTASTTSKKEKLNAALTSDPLAVYIGELGIVKSAERDGKLHIVCPFEAEHTGPSSDSATTYFPANTGGYAQGHFDCKHAHCAHRTDEDFKRALGYDDLVFEDLTHAAALPEAPTTSRYRYIHADDYVHQPPLGYHIKGLIPKVEMVMLFGPPQGGKSFLALDMAASVARGVPWRGHRVHQGTVAYIAAEGSGGFVNRLAAYKSYHGVASLDVHVLPATPNFMNGADIKELIAATVEVHPVLIIIDTWSQVTAGGNENSGEDMGKALAQARKLYNATKATCLIVHHSGKDAERGARGWSGLLGAADAMLEIRRSGDDRVMTNTKQKDGIEGQEFGFRLNMVNLGVDADGDPVTSCVVVESEVTRAEVSLGKNEKLLVRAVEDSMGLAGEWPDVNTVIEAAIAQLPRDSSGRDRRRDVVLRSYKKCVERGILVENEGRVEHVKNCKLGENGDTTTPQLTT